MTKHKYMEEIDELGSRENGEEAAPTKQKSTRAVLRFFLIVVLLGLCGTGIYLIHKLNKNELHLAASTQTLSPRYTLRMPTIEKKASVNSERQLSGVVKPVEMTSHPVAKQSVDLALSDSVETEDEATDSFETEVLQPVVNEIDSQQKSNTLLLALTLKDHFLSGASCQAAYALLKEVKDQSALVREVLNNMAPFCQHAAPATDGILRAFENGKRKALVALYRTENPWWLASLKSFGTYLVQVRRLNPVSVKPKDLLYRIQNAIYQNNISQADRLARQLPPYMREQMPTFFRETGIYLRAVESVNRLILSVEEKEK